MSQTTGVNSNFVISEYQDKVVQLTQENVMLRAIIAQAQAEEKARAVEGAKPPVTE